MDGLNDDTETMERKKNVLSDCPPCLFHEFTGHAKLDTTFLYIHAIIMKKEHKIMVMGEMGGIITDVPEDGL
jgi:hypothetical protein